MNTTRDFSYTAPLDVKKALKKYGVVDKEFSLYLVRNRMDNMDDADASRALRTIIFWTKNKNFW